MDWKEATDLGQEAAELIGKLQKVFDDLSQAGYIVGPPSWRQIEQSFVVKGHERALTLIELEDRLTLASVIEPRPIDGPPEKVKSSEPWFDVDTGLPLAADGHGEVPRWVANIDAQTCPNCRERDGEAWDPHQLPHCQNEVCRCVVGRPG